MKVWLWSWRLGEYGNVVGLGLGWCGGVWGYVCGWILRGGAKLAVSEVEINGECEGSC